MKKRHHNSSSSFPKTLISENPQMPNSMLLPFDIIVEILTRLPVKSLLRFRCVSKSFCSLIDGKDFMNRHLTNSNPRPSLIISLSMWKPESRIYSLSLDSLDHCVEIARRFRNCMYDVIGSCNGLLAMQNCSKGMILLNPLTQSHREIPNFYGDLLGCDACFDGFGYDVASDDYKLVRISMLTFPEYHIETSVYSLKNNSSRKVKDFPYHFWVGRGNGAFVNGALHWIANRNQEGFRDELMVAFDLKNEEFYEVPMPLAVGNGGIFMGVDVLGGCLSLVCICDSGKPSDVWVMKEYGVKDSWTKLFSLTEEVIDSCDYVKAVAYTTSGDKVVVVNSNGVVYLCDLETQRVESGIEIDVEEIANCDNGIVCVDSLVSLDAYTGNR